MSRILLIEDEERIARVLQLELEHEGYEVHTRSDGRSGLNAALNESDWELVLLDVMLPELSGLEVLRRIRQVNATLPIILLTARDAVSDRVSGLDQGANDYVTKPFATIELLARIRSLLRQRSLQDQTSEQPHLFKVDDLTMDLKSRAVAREGVPIELTPTEFDLLRFLIQHQDEVMSREQIISEVWGYDFVGDTNVVDVYIRYLRQKVDKPFSSKLIQTIRGVGYLLRSGSSSTDKDIEDKTGEAVPKDDQKPL
ncbi:DNA-binding response regulator, OmpR family, contains REC and winged-helix (wHTH) domain [Paenibacillus sp. yr247]|uniref:response regulator transcription factor n=1 Tax=Paenibacillus sp. yr247 TaxID=1761880 RepID=UPI00088B78D4|nr:response regulator transcription factor [Paenibacillus sp. yr247]SDO68549.1 DNA-binding response regulator, OmpR family, contains REC and winged-helix (wHTH) domain [Paenibacillus sp. yr247]